jgi:hypothetical protein
MSLRLNISGEEHILEKAAIRLEDGRVLCGACHAEILDLMVTPCEEGCATQGNTLHILIESPATIPEPLPQEAFGFVTHRGIFVSRREVESHFRQKVDSEHVCQRPDPH